MKSRHTLPERLLAEALRSAAVDFTQHDKTLPGTPDLVVCEAKIAIFVNGCYWHRHSRCGAASLPKRDSLLWARRFAYIVQNDQVVLQRLRSMGWQPYVAWECEILANSAGTGELVAAEAARKRQVDGSALPA